MTLRKKPCSVCRRWSYPDPRVGARQRTCGDPACRAEQRRRTQAKWRAHNPDYWAERRLREQFERHEEAEDSAQDAIDAGSPGAATVAGRAGTPASAPVVRPPPAALARVPWDLAQDAFGAQGIVMIAFLLRLALRSAQDATNAHVAEMQAEIRRLQHLVTQDAIGRDVASGHDPP